MVVVYDNDGWLVAAVPGSWNFFPFAILSKWNYEIDRIYVCV